MARSVFISVQKHIEKKKGVYSSRIYKAVKQGSGITGILAKTTSHSGNDYLRLVASEAARLALGNKRRAITCREIQRAARTLALKDAKLDSAI
ncbi:H2B3 protein, partial [Polypterus senegalus]